MAKLPPGIKQFCILVTAEMHQQLKLVAVLHHTSVQELTIRAYETILHDVHSRTSVAQPKPKRRR